MGTNNGVLCTWRKSNDMHSGMNQTEADDGNCEGETRNFRGIETPNIKSAGVVTPPVADTPAYGHMTSKHFK